MRLPFFCLSGNYNSNIIKRQPQQVTMGVAAFCIAVLLSTVIPNFANSAVVPARPMPLGTPQTQSGDQAKGQTKGQTDRQPLTLTIAEVKGKFIKITLPADAPKHSLSTRVAKGIVGKIFHGQSTEPVASAKITVIETDYAVGKLVQGQATAGDSIQFAAPKKAAAKSKTKRNPYEIPDGERNTPLGKTEFNRKLLELHQSRRLTSEAMYPALRNLHSRRFEHRHAAKIKSALGGDFDAMQQWFNENSDIKEELFTAIDAKHDDIENVVRIFNEIRTKFPKKIVPYSDLAIATSVVWDKRNGVYDYGRHQRRAKATLPENLMNGIESFQYLVDAEPFMEGRILYVPWEFLKHVVNHYTPHPERQWAAEMYYPKRHQFAKSYHDVPYDHVMLDSKSERGALNNHEYTLSNIKKYGGVCAHQADFASRVGKSIGVPTAYVRGPGTFGGYHAWVMWIELKSATQKSINFSLESHGRYNNDLYYVGELIDPQTGKWVTDRSLELRLHSVGQNAIAKRHADLIMRSFPTISKADDLSPGDQIAFLKKVIDLCPGNERAWRTLANLSDDFVNENKRNRRKMLKIVDFMFGNFSSFPDFTWNLFEPLIRFETDTKQISDLYARLLALYLDAERPDLAMKARLKLTDHLLTGGEKIAAIEGLASTILALPHEARYVPKMLDRIDSICKTDSDLAAHRADFYAQFLPLVPKYRGKTPSKFCVKMFKRAIQLFEQESRMELATLARKELDDIQSGVALERDRKKK